MAKKNGWELIEWDGNHDLHEKCWRKKFGRGHVSVGVGDFLLVCYSYGAKSDDSVSSTRWNYGTVVSEKDMMDFVDANNGKLQSYPLKPGQYRDWFNSLEETRQNDIQTIGLWHQEKMAI